MISVVIPVAKGRRANLELALYALELQTFQDFEIVIGAEDNENEWAIDKRTRLIVTPNQRPNLGAVNRNAAAHVANGDHIVFIDSDVLLHRSALGRYAADWHDYSERIIVAPYHWLPPGRVTKEDVEEWETLVDRLDLDPNEVPHHNTGFDGRTVFGNSPDKLFCNYPDCLDLLSGNMGISKKMFEYVGGFDEELPRGIDGDFGIACCAAGFSWSYDGYAVGLHVYHERNSEAMALDPFPRIIQKWHSDDSWIGKMTWGER